MAKLLVTGATGQLGRGVLQHLLTSYGVAPRDIIAGTRNPAAIADQAAQGVETRAVDFDDPAALVKAFAGVDRVLIISTSELAVPGKRLQQQSAAVTAATAAGVKHIVYTSMPNPATSVVTFSPDHLGTEKAIQASGLSYTILRNSWYTDNYLHSLPHVLATGTWYTATGEGRTPNISRDDCARAAAAALANPPAGNAVLTLTGPDSLTIAEVAAQVSAVTGKPIAVQQVPNAAFAAGLESAGLPPFLATALASADADILAGNFDLLTGDYQTLTGQKPQSVRAFLEAHKAALIG